MNTEKKTINILQFAPHIPPYRSGLGTVAQEIAKHYTAQGYGKCITLTSSAGQKKLMQKLQREKSEKLIKYKQSIIGYQKKGYQILIVPSFDLIYNFPVPKFRDPTYKKIMQYCQEQNIHIVHTHTRFFARTLRGGRYATRKQKGRVHTEHGSNFAVLNATRKTRCARIRDETLGRIILKRAKVVAISKGVGSFIEKLGQKNYTLIYNGIDFSPISSSKETKKTIGFVGRLVKLKGVDLLIDSFIEIQKEYPAWTLHILGEGDEEDSLKQKVQNAGLSDHITFYGSKPRDRIAQHFLQKIDILTNPSLMEGLPTVVLEGLLAQCIVVATDVGGTKEISDKEDLIICPPNDQKQWTQAVQKGIQSLEHKGKSYAQVKKNFDRDQQIQRYYQLYQKTLEKSSQTKG